MWVYPTETVAFVPRFPHTLTARGHPPRAADVRRFPAEDAVHARVRLVTRDGPVLERLVTITPDDDTIELPLDTPLPAQPDGLQLGSACSAATATLLVRHAEVVAR
ncbi:MAG: hypothetical protein H6733_13945 [Alphaproteobacteria bacterium]|nr:hypothetical protein [Alphaproteobacteria bacterium]